LEAITKGELLVSAKLGVALTPDTLAVTVHPPAVELAVATMLATPLEFVLAVTLEDEDVPPLLVSVPLAPNVPVFTVKTTSAPETAPLAESVTFTWSATPNCTPMFAA
jgi:hypothetical protein